MNMLEVTGLSVHFGGLRAVSEVDFHVGAHEIVGLVGPNGAGKTTIFNVISGMLPPTAGRIRLFEDDITGLAPGDYQVFAWESTGDGVITDPDFRKAFDGQATPIKLSEKSHQNLDAQLIPMAAMEVEAAKLR